MSIRGLVAFDLDGTLVHISSAWSWIHRFLGTLEKATHYADLYYAGKIDYNRWAELDVKLWHGVPFQRIKEAVQESLDFLPGSYKLIQSLRSWGLKTAIISSGLDVFTNRAGEVLGIDINRANCLTTDAQGRISGVEVHVAYDNKHEVLKEIANSLEIPLTNCAAIGDSPNDIPMFNVAGMSIAFNAVHEEVVKNASTAINNENALALLPPLQQFFKINSAEKT